MTMFIYQRAFITHDGGLHSICDMDKYRDVVALGAIHVGEKTFIGYKIIIMLGVKIGKRCIIGAKLIITKIFQMILKCSRAINVKVWNFWLK